MSVAQTTDGFLWISTFGGLARFDGVTFRVFDTVTNPDFRYRDGRFTRFTSREGLPTNGAFEILEDDQARFWICSNAGIYRVARSDLDEVADRPSRSWT